jgi:hypothetical protein
MTEIVLNSTVKSCGVEIRKLNMREPKVRDMLLAEKAGKTDAEREITMFAALCEVEPAVIEDLGMRDYARLQEAYKGFLS